MAPKARVSVVAGQKSLKLDNRPRAFILPNATIDLKDNLKAKLSILAGFQGVTPSNDGSVLLVTFASRGQAEAGVAQLPEVSNIQWHQI